MRGFKFFFLTICFLSVLRAVLCTLPRPGTQTADAKWVRISVNMVTSTTAQVLAIVDRARSAGANAIVIDDVKLLTWWFRYPGNTWENRMLSLREGIRNRGLDFIITSEGIGYCHAPLAKNVNLAAGYPMKKVAMKVTSSNSLEPVQQVSVPNPSFERSVGDEVSGWGYQDSPGTLTFIDSTVSHSGSKSLRLSPQPSGNARIFSRHIQVKPFHQYTLSAWTKASDLTTGFTAILIFDSSTDVDLTEQSLSLPRENDRAYFSSARQKSFDWTEQKLSFNSLRTKEITIVLGVWGGTGTMWWDDLTIVSSPTLNLLRRNSLPFKLVKEEDGSRLKEGIDYEAVSDPKLGRVLSYKGVYDTYHTAPVIKLKGNAAGLSEGDVVHLSGYHTMITQDGQVGCSWSDDELHSIIAKIHRKNEIKFSPDGIFLGHNEIRTGGWEPKEVETGTAGKALAAFFRREIKNINRITKGRRTLYMWSDMIDPNHNAVKNYYQVRGSLRGSHRGVSKNRVVIANWLGNYQPDGRKSYDFFDTKGYTQVAAAFYDEDVTENRMNWIESFDGRSSAGSMYTTWTYSEDQPFDGDFSQLEQFGQVWW